MGVAVTRDKLSGVLVILREGGGVYRGLGELLLGDTCDGNGGFEAVLVVVVMVVLVGY